MVFARVLGLCWTGPALAHPAIGVRTRLLAALLLAIVTSEALPGRISVPESTTEFVFALIGELVFGAALGASAALIIAGARQAGEIVGAQAGLSAAALLDPEIDEDMSVFGHLYSMIALAVFIGLDGPLILVRVFLASYESWPVGRMLLDLETTTMLFARVGDALVLALGVAAPAAAALMMAGFAIAMLSRSAPALPFSALALPLRSFCALLLVILGLVALTSTLSDRWIEWARQPF
jgi:flagellar biosynthesis protein FliR